MKGVIGKEYTIQKVKVGKQIILELADDNEDIIKAKISIDNSYKYNVMKSCRSFFLVDKFESDKKT